MLALGDEVLSIHHQLYQLYHNPNLSPKVKKIMRKFLVVLGDETGRDGKVMPVDTAEDGHYAQSTSESSPKQKQREESNFSKIYKRLFP